MKNYRLIADDTILQDGKKLTRIQALRDILHHQV